MMIGKLTGGNDTGLDKYTGDLSGTDQELIEASDLLYALMDESYRCSGNCLEAEYNGHRENVQGLYWKCKEMLEKTTADPDRTGFLAMSAIEQSYSMARPLLLLRVEDILDNNADRFIQQARRLEAILADNPYKKIWSERSALYVSILERIGFSPESADFSDLTAIMDPLLDALSFYHKDDRGRTPAVYRIRSGERSSARFPAIARAMCRYSSEKELVDAVMAAPTDTLAAFGAIEKTHRQVKDYFYEYVNGYPEERQRNMMRNEKMTPEEYLAAPCDYTRKVYLCVKSGGTCWLVHMPWKGDMYYGHIGDKDAEYYYGHRASYAPYQIFYKDAAPAPEGSTMLAIKQDGYLLADLLDPLSMAWFPAFMDETAKYFFRETEPVSKDMVLPEETAATVPGSDTGGQSTYAVVPVASGVPAVCSWTYTVPDPRDMFQEPWMHELLDKFDITAADMAGVPILPSKMGTSGDYFEDVSGKARRAYVRILAGRIADFMQARWDARRWLLQKTGSNSRNIISMAGDGDLMAFMTVIVEGTPVLDKDGNQKFETMDRYPYTKRAAVDHVDPSDARDESYRSGILGKMVLWASDRTSGKPGVVWKLRPCEPEHYAAMAGTDVSGLPEVLQWCGHISKFYAAHAGSLPDSLTNKYTAAGYGDGDRKSIFCPCLIPVNVCMTKKAHKAFPYFKPDSKPAKGGR